MTVHATVVGILLLSPLYALAAQTATVLWYAEQEAGTRPYKVRYIVSEQYMRSDDGQDQGDFVLYDRRRQQIYSVAHEERRVLQIDGKGMVPAAPETLAMKVDKTIDKDAPTVAGRHPVTVRLFAGQQSCYTATVLPDFLPDVRGALLEFNRALAVQQLRSLDNTPEDFRTPCFLLRYLYATDFSLVHGLPLADLDGSGDRRELLDYQTGVHFEDELFKIPDDYLLDRLGTTHPATP
jgi:hypothetical protein